MSAIGYCPKTKTGFLTHYDSLTELQLSFEKVFAQLRSLGNDTGDTLEVFLLSGQGPSTLVDRVRSCVYQGGFTIHTKGEELHAGSGNVALDTRDGSLSGFDMVTQSKEVIDAIESRLSELSVASYGPANFVYTCKKNPTPSMG